LGFFLKIKSFRNWRVSAFFFEKKFHENSFVYIR
jgi:hypothetical protein